MDWGELLTRSTIWLAIGGYALGVGLGLLFRDRQGWQQRARWAWTIGCAGLVAHTICAFHFYHAWSQTSAYQETARQTAAVTGWNWGGGLFINYAFLAAWMGDVVWWWRGLRAYQQRHWLIAAAWQAIFIFMIFNATVVFKTGVVRWLGVALCGGLLFIWCYVTLRRKTPANHVTRSKEFIDECGEG